ncbi:MAG: hypothetical protein R2788_14990 [Saprospiraceae bacterium]
MNSPISQGSRHSSARNESENDLFAAGPLIFNAFNTTPVDQVKAAVLGHDPYIKPARPWDFPFPSLKGVRAAPSLQNIYKELNSDLSCPIPTHGDLTKWAEQGVFLLNASLTVEQGKSNSHAKCGWHTFTDAVIRNISEEKEGLVFMLWGNFAKQKLPSSTHSSTWSWKLHTLSTALRLPFSAANISPKPTSIWPPKAMKQSIAYFFNGEWVNRCIIHHSPFTVHHSPFTVHRSPLIHLASRWFIAHVANFVVTNGESCWYPSMNCSS